MCYLNVFGGVVVFASPGFALPNTANQMDDTIRALGELLIQSLPTFFIVLFLFAYLRQIIFKPLDKVLAERKEATQGAREHAAQALDRASAKAAEYEEQLRLARNEIYKEQEAQRLMWREQQATQLTEARRSSDAAIAAAKAGIATEAEIAKQSLATQTQSLADGIARAVLSTGRSAK